VFLSNIIASRISIGVLFLKNFHIILIEYLQPGRISLEDFNELATVLRRTVTNNSCFFVFFKTEYGLKKIEDSSTPDFNTLIKSFDSHFIIFVFIFIFAVVLSLGFKPFHNLHTMITYFYFLLMLILLDIVYIAYINVGNEVEVLFLSTIISFCLGNTRYRWYIQILVCVLEA
jgi:hypothetical protein